MQEVHQREPAVPAVIETQVQVAEVGSGDVGVIYAVWIGSSKEVFMIS